MVPMARLDNFVWNKVGRTLVRPERVKTMDDQNEQREVREC